MGKLIKRRKCFLLIEEFFSIGSAGVFLQRVIGFVGELVAGRCGDV